MTVNYSPEIDDIDIFFSPNKALQRMVGLCERDGIKQALKADAFKPVREAWAAAVFLLGYSQITKNQYWLRENPKKNEAPDVFAIGFHEPKPDEKGVTREVIEIEVCEYDEHATDNIADHIKKKLKGMAYNSSTFLLCYIHVKGETKLIDVINGLKGIPTSVREIWLLFHIDKAPIGNFMIARVFLRGEGLDKTNLQYVGNYIDLTKIEQKDMVKPMKGSGRKVDFFHLGRGYVPLPRLKKKHQKTCK